MGDIETADLFVFISSDDKLKPVKPFPLPKKIEGLGRDQRVEYLTRANFESVLTLMMSVIHSKRRRGFLLLLELNNLCSTSRYLTISDALLRSLCIVR